MSYRVRLGMFEGPLDLLLYLIQINEIDIYDIPIARITEEYLQCLATMQELDLAVAGEFLVIAATLIHIKSKMLIPVEEIDGTETPEEDPRKELVERLLEYKRFRESAMALEELEARQQLFFARPPDPSAPVDPGPLEVSLSELLDAFSVIIQRGAAASTLEITPEAINVADQMVAILDRLTLESPLPFPALFDGVMTRMLLIATFLGLLELLRRGLVRARQSALDGEIIVYCVMEPSEGGHARSA